MTHVGGIARVKNIPQDQKISGDPEQPEPDHQNSGYSAGPKGNFKRRLQTAGSRRIGGSDIRPDRDMHADIAGKGGQNSANKKSDCRQPVQTEAEAAAQLDRLLASR